MLMHELRTFVEDSAQSFRPGAQKADANSVPLILCADLNSLPESGVVDFLSSGRISADHSDFKELGYKDCLRKLSCSDKANEYTHPFKITKAYGDDIMPFTNYTSVSPTRCQSLIHSSIALFVSLLGSTSKV